MNQAQVEDLSKRYVKLLQEYRDIVSMTTIFMKKIQEIRVELLEMEELLKEHGVTIKEDIIDESKI